MNNIRQSDDPAYDALRQLDEATEDERDIQWRHVMTARVILDNGEDALHGRKIDEAIDELDGAARPGRTDYGRQKNLQRAHSILCEVVYGR